MLKRTAFAVDARAFLLPLGAGALRRGGSSGGKLTARFLEPVESPLFIFRELAVGIWTLLGRVRTSTQLEIEARGRLLVAGGGLATCFA